MRHAILFLTMLLIVAAVGCDPSRQGGGAEQLISVRGKLTSVMAIGGETTGWAIELQKPIEVEGKQLRQIEIDGDRQAWPSLEGKVVEARGKIAFREGVERGRYPILQVESIRE